MNKTKKNKCLGGGRGGGARQTQTQAPKSHKKRGLCGYGSVSSPKKKKRKREDRICDTRHKLALFLCVLAFLAKVSRTMAQLLRRCPPTAAGSAPVLRRQGRLDCLEFHNLGRSRTWKGPTGTALEPRIDAPSEPPYSESRPLRSATRRCVFYLRALKEWATIMGIGCQSSNLAGCFEEICTDVVVI